MTLCRYCFADPSIGEGHQPGCEGDPKRRKVTPKAKASTDPYGNKPGKASEPGGVIVYAPGTGKGMKVARANPCAECPLRRDSVPGYLGGWSPEMYLEALHGNVSLACHSSPGFKEGETERQHECTGVAGYRANVGHVCFSTAHASTVAIGEDDRFFGSPRDFYEHHKKGQDDDQP